MKSSQLSRLASFMAPRLTFACALACVGACSSNSAPATSNFEGGLGGTDAGHDATKSQTDSSMLQGSDVHTAPMEACAATSAAAKQTALDIYFLLDRSGSMAYNHAWTDEVQALEDFIYDTRSFGIGVGLGYMPQVDLCNVAAYTPAVPIGTLPGAVDMQQALLATSLNTNQPFGGTPTTIGLEAAVAAAAANQAANPTHTTIIVFSSDGVDINGCAVVPDGGGLTNTTANAISVVAGAAAMGIKTFVIGINPEPKLNDYAVAGGTGSAILLGAPDGGVTEAGAADAAVVDIEGALIAAFNAVRSTALPCKIKIPASTGGSINYNNVNVTFSPTAGSDAGTETFYGVTAASGCQTTSNDWYYDNPLDPQNIEFCPTACAAVQASKTGSFNVEFGCTPTLAAPIK